MNEDDAALTSGRQRQPLLPSSRASLSTTARKGNDEMKPCISPREHRQRLMLLAAMIIVLVLYCLNHDWTNSPLLMPGSPPRAPPLPLVPFTPLPGSSDPATLVEVSSEQGLKHYTLGAAAIALAASSTPPPVRTFHVYVPSSVDGSARAPLVLALHGRDSEGGAECEQWTTHAERYGWIIVCPTLAANIERDVDSLAHSVTFIQSVLDSSFAESSSVSLGRLVNPSSVLLTAHNSAGAAWLNFLLLRPNFWSSASCRSCNMWRLQFEQVLEPETNRVATRDHVAQASPALFWARFFQHRSLLLQWGERDLPLILSHMADLQTTLQTMFGFAQLQPTVIIGESHESRTDVTAKWWASKLAQH